MAEKAVSNLKTIFDVRSKTFWSLLLAFVSLAIDAVLQFDGVPKIVLSIVQVVLFLFAGFGMTDAAKQAKEELLQKLKDYVASMPAIGIVIEALAHLSETIPDMPNMPAGVLFAAKCIGVLLVVMGFRKVSAQARANMDSRNQEAVEKYRHLLG